MSKFGIKYSLFSAILICLSFIANAQDSNTDDELEIIIDILENYSNDETYSLNEVNLLSLNIEKQQSYVAELKTELKNINTQITNLDNTVEKLEIELNTSKTIYKKLIYFAFLYQYQYNNFTFVISASDINKIFSRIKYLKLLTQYRSKIIEAINFINEELTFHKEILLKYSDIKKNVIVKINSQNVILEADINKKILAIANLQQKNSELRKEVLNKEDLFAEILKYLNLSTQITDDEMVKINSEFVAAKGFFKLPLKNGIVVKKFGEYKHPVLEQVTVRNDGIDIAPSDNYAVRAVFEGLVTNIISVPGENNAVLIKHGDYFTVYTNIIDLEVVANQKVSENQIIGNIPEIKDEVSVMNFQIWYLTEKQNPMDWIKF